MLAPLDLVYVCGNKFLATNGTHSPVQVTYRVVGTGESGALTLDQAPLEDPAHSELELETTEQGTVELYRGEERVARRRNGGLSCGANAISPSVAAAGDPVSAGSWSAPFPWPVVALHLSLLPDGRVLSWGHAGTPQVWDPATGEFLGVPSPALLFCAGHAFLPDGRLLVAGGHITDDHGLPDINLSPRAPRLDHLHADAPGPLVSHQHHAAPSGDVVILAGRDEAGLVVGDPEVWSGGSFRVLTGREPNLPLLPPDLPRPQRPGVLRRRAADDEVSEYERRAARGPRCRQAALRDPGLRRRRDVRRGKILYVGGGRTTNTAEIIDLTRRRRPGSGPARWRTRAAPERHGAPHGRCPGDGRSRRHGLQRPARGRARGRVLESRVPGVDDPRQQHRQPGLSRDVASCCPTGECFTPAAATAPARRMSETPRCSRHPISSRAPADHQRRAVQPSATAQRSGATPRRGRDRQGEPDPPGLGDARVRHEPALPVAQLRARRRGVVRLCAASRNDTPPGHYMLFLLDGNGVPSGRPSCGWGLMRTSPSDEPAARRGLYVELQRPGMQLHRSERR